MRAPWCRAAGAVVGGLAPKSTLNGCSFSLPLLHALPLRGATVDLSSPYVVMVVALPVGVRTCCGAARPLYSLETRARKITTTSRAAV
jgi:hypothetical protein